MAEKPPAIGIDLGTTYSCVAVYEHGAVEIIANDQGNRTTPSYVGFTDRERFIGDAAKGQVAMNPENTVFDTKRLIGRRFDDEAVQGDMVHFPFNVVNEDGKPSVEVEYRGQAQKFLPEQIASMILAKMKETAEAYLGTNVTDAVITVPAYFNNAQRVATKNAGEIAGLNVLRIINEPTAAAIAYGLDKRAQGSRNVMVFDLGGGTFDVSMLEINDGVFEVKSTAGDTHLGGEDFDNRLVDYFVDEINRKHQKDISNDRRALRQLRTACEQAKCTLSSATKATLDIPALYDGVDFTSNITRAKFEELCLDLFSKTLNSVEKAIMDARVDKAEIDEIVLVGGSSRIPKIQRLLQEYLDGKELNTSINPEEAIAYGAAVQAAIINGDDPEILQDLVLLDIIPLSLGIDTIGGIMATMIPRNSPIPNKQIHYATTNSAYQTNVIVTVYEGERQLTKDNNLLGEFNLTGIRQAHNNDLPIIEVAFELDVNGILSVSATDIETGAKNQIKIENDTGRLTQAQIDQMKRAAEINGQQDELERSRIEARNFLELYLDHIKSTMDQVIARANIPPMDQQRIARKVDEIENWFYDTVMASKEELDAKRTELTNLCDPILRNMNN